VVSDKKLGQGTSFMVKDACLDQVLNLKIGGKGVKEGKKIVTSA